MAEKTLNLKGLKCPLPVLRTRKVLSSLPAGHVLVVECTDPLAAIDIPHLLHETGDTLESTSHAAGVTTFRIRKSPRRASNARPAKVGTDFASDRAPTLTVAHDLVGEPVPTSPDHAQGTSNDPDPIE